VWLINYCSLFVVTLWFVNQRIIRNTILNNIAAGAGALIVIIYLTGGLVELQALRNAYLSEDAYFIHGFWNIGVRYITYIFIDATLFIIYRVVKNENKPSLFKLERLFFHFTLLTILSSELLTWLTLAQVLDGSRLALSILWGTYALYLIIWGLFKDFPFLRMAGIGLFGITLAKLFLYDLTGMSTIGKTIVLMILGVLLLIASFIYNKRKKNQENTNESKN
ncbi:MAG TPA: DUF2339 domain-containing protein, partial [Cyclobacteriaceae bacterium]|nr:DUF2339 domain-containing protein [Cyclobacteriaceae bacterium]